MAFSNSQVDPVTGIACTYWTLIAANIDRLAQLAHVVVGGWPTQALHDSGKAPLMQQSYDWSGAAFPLPDSNPTAAALIAQFEAAIQNLAPFHA